MHCFSPNAFIASNLVPPTSYIRFCCPICKEA